MYLRKALFQAGTEIEEILKWKIGMQATDDVKFSHRLTVARRRRFEGLLKRHGVGARRIFLSPERAEATGGDAYIRGIDVAIHVEVGLVAMHALADMVRHPAHGQHIAGAVQCEGIGGIETLAGSHFVMNRLQPQIVSLKWMALVRGKHPYDDIAGSHRTSQGGGVSRG